MLAFSFRAMDRNKRRPQRGFPEREEKTLERSRVFRPSIGSRVMGGGDDYIDDRNPCVENVMVVKKSLLQSTSRSACDDRGLLHRGEARVLMVVEEPPISLANPFPQIELVPPSQAMQAGHVEQLAGRTIRF